MNTIKKAVAVIFALKRTGENQSIEVFSVEGENNFFELPSGVNADAGGDYRTIAVSAVLNENKNINISEKDLIPVPVEDGSVVYAAVLQEKPKERYRGNNWISVSSDGSVPEDSFFAEKHQKLVKVALEAILNVLVSPFAQSEGISQELKAGIWQALMPQARKSAWLESIKGLGVDTGALSLNGGYNYKYMHPNLTVDMVLLTLKEKELAVLMIKRTGNVVGSGYWGLPGGFVDKSDFEDAGWEDNLDEEYFKKDMTHEKYLKEIARGESVVEKAAKKYLEKKTGVVLSDETQLYDLTAKVQDNPRHGAYKGGDSYQSAPIISRSFLAIIPDYKQFESTIINDKNIEDIQWFTIHRRLFKGGVLVFEEPDKIKRENKKPLADYIEGRKCFDLRYDTSKTEAYVDLKDKRLLIDYCALNGSDKGSVYEDFKKRAVKNKPIIIAEKERLYFHHADVIVAALKVIQEKIFTEPILANFIIKNPAKGAWNDKDNLIPQFDYFRKLRDTVKCLLPPSVRQNLMSKVIANELDEAKEREILSKKNETELVEEAINKYKISEDSLAGLSKDQIIDIVLDEMAYSWEDPSGKIHRITNRGFLIKNPNGDSSYFLSKELYERFLYLGSTV